MKTKSAKTSADKAKKADPKLKARLARFDKRKAAKKVMRKKNAEVAGKKKVKVAALPPKLAAAQVKK